MADRMRRSVTSAVRTCPSTMCRRAVANSVIADLDLKTAFGALFSAVRRESDEKVPGSLHAALLSAAAALTLEAPR